MISITVQLNFDYALCSIFFSLWQALVENGARSQLEYLAVLQNNKKTQESGSFYYHIKA
jgi:hypothetical protein